VSAPTLVKIQPSSSQPGESKKEHIFDVLRRVQRHNGYLSPDQLTKIAEYCEVHLRDVHAVASYYPHFRLKPPATVEVRICGDMTCHLRGARTLQQTLEQSFSAIAQEELDIRHISCLGRCDHAPALEINGHYYDQVSADQAVNLVNSALRGPLPPESRCVVDENPLRIDPYEGQTSLHYDALRKYVRSGDWKGLLEELKAAGLQGMGGAGFPTGVKWETVKNASSGEDTHDKYVVCNADESEPGTIKDRFILTRLPHLVIEGMILAGLFVGAKRGYLYIRHEYKEQEEILRKELEACRREGLIGQKILGKDLNFELDLFVSPGGYICGEESALLEAIEGKRAEPRNKPPYVATDGLWGKPTVVNNVETLAFAAAIAAKGGSWFNSYGLNEEKNVNARGLKFVGVSGDVREPGVFEVPMGITTYEDLIYSYAKGLSKKLPPGKKLELVAFAPSGPSSGYLPPSKINLLLDWKTLDVEKSMVGSGAIVVCATGTCMLDMALNAVRFYRNESCGKCVPCRIGSQKMVEILERWTRGGYDKADDQMVQDLCHTLRQASICGLGQIVPAPVESVFRHFQSEIDEHLLHRRCPAGVCFGGGKA
jgi:NADH:ubiquinone oxidoreductase subunit F (NADH-binding)/NADH:ubiquinone oxidoreductase subunit E